MRHRRTPHRGVLGQTIDLDGERAGFAFGRFTHILTTPEHEVPLLVAQDERNGDARRLASRSGIFLRTNGPAPSRLTISVTPYAPSASTRSTQ